MRTLEPKITNWETVEWRHTSKWCSPQTVRAHDMADFGPDAPPDPWAAQPASQGRKKPVLYVPIPRRRKEELYPKVSLTIRLEVLGHATSMLSAFDGSSVEIEVLNRWNPTVSPVPSVPLKKLAQLKDGACTVDFSADDMKAWLDPRGDLKGRLNESLLDFRFRIPSMLVRGAPFEGTSNNRLFLYRRRNILFLPGVFGSQIQFEDDNGQVVGFPNWDRNIPDVQSTVEENLAVFLSYINRISSQEIGVLECDSQGEPLAEAVDPKLLMMAFFPDLRVPAMTLVADVFRALHHARQTGHPELPEHFLLYRLIGYPYDWRKDLESTALAQLKELKTLQASNLAREAVDYDDEFTLVGHSTGGLLIRRMMREHEAEGLIDHVFFVNVPFRGAVKPASVIPTGRDPLDGKPMIDFVDPASLVSIALTAPLVYHLSATTLATEVTFRKKGHGPPEEFKGMDGVREFVKLALRIGLMPGRKVIRSVTDLSKSERRKLALSAPDWDHYWDDRFERERSHRLLEWLQDRDDPWPRDQIVARGLEAQDAARVEAGWSQKLEDDAARFHRKCEKGWAGSNDGWVDRAYLFYSVNEIVPTTLGMEAVCEVHKTYPTLVELLNGMGIHPREVDQPRPLLREMLPRIKRTRRVANEPFEHGIWRVENVQREGDHYVWEIWKFTSLQQCLGDGTVPLWSQLGFGVPVKVFNKVIRSHVSAQDAETYPRGPKHMDAPNSRWTWLRILDVLRGEDISGHLVPAGQVNTVNGKHIDRSLDPASAIWADVLKNEGVP